MIEEIKKEIELYIIKNHKDRYDELVDDIWEILDKYNNQKTRYEGLLNLKVINKLQELEKYKNAWEELYSEKEMPCSIEYMQNLEDKYNLVSVEERVDE